jgi:broad-specificity NMP kinase
MTPAKFHEVIIIRGAPGSGKSQTAKSLCRYFHEGIRLEVDTVRQMVISVDWTNQAEHIQILEIATEMVHRFQMIGFRPVIVIDTFSGNKLEKFLDDLKRRGKKKYAIKIFSLYCSDQELKQRLESRTDNGFKDYKISNDINNQTRKEIYADEIKIDTTGLSQDESAERVYKALSIVV